MPGTPVYSFRADRVDPVQGPGRPRTQDVNLAIGTYPKGTILGQISGANAADVQTITVAATGGTYRLYLPQVGQYTAALAYNANVAAIQAAVTAALGAGNATVTGAGPYVVTAAGIYANEPVATISVDNSLATGGLVSVAHTTSGVGPSSSYTAYASGNTDGSNVARGILTYSCVVTVPQAGDLSGFNDISYGSEYGRTYKVTPIYVAGVFATGDLVGPDAGAVTSLGANLFWGTLANGKIEF